MRNRNPANAPSGSDIRNNGAIPYASQVPNDSEYHGNSVGDALNLAKVVGCTHEDMDLYVAATGSDEKGTGTESNPYLTITRAYEDVPYTLRHYVHIHIGAGVYTDFPAEVINSYGSDCFLSFDGSAAMADVAEGPFTIAAGGWTQLDECFVVDMVEDGGGLTPSAWKGKFVQFLTGAIAGAIAPILDNDATTVRLQIGYTSAAPGDTFKIIEPGVTIMVPAGKSVLFVGNEESLGLLGVHFVAIEHVEFKDVSMSCTGSIIDTDGVDLFGVSMDHFCWVGTTKMLDNPGLVSGYNGGAIFGRTPATTGLLTFRGSHSGASSCVFFRAVDIWNGSLSIGPVSIIDPTTYGIDAYSMVGSLRVHMSYIECKSTKSAVQNGVVACLSVGGLYVQNALAAFTISVGLNSARIGGLVGVDANVANAFLIGQGSSVAMNTTTCTLVGSGGAGTAIKWSSGAADSAYPAANSVVTDSLGAQVVGY